MGAASWGYTMPATEDSAAGIVLCAFACHRVSYYQFTLLVDWASSL